MSSLHDVINCEARQSGSDSARSVRISAGMIHSEEVDAVKSRQRLRLLLSARLMREHFRTWGATPADDVGFFVVLIRAMGSEVRELDG